MEKEYSELNKELSALNLDYDVLQLEVREEYVSTILKYFAMLKWELVSNNENARFFDIRLLSFRRKHFIENKVQLQRLEGELEEVIDLIETKRIRKHLPYLLSLFILGFLLIVSLTFGSLFHCNVFNLDNYVLFETSFFVISGMLSIAISINSYVLNKSSEKYFKYIMSKYDKKINELEAKITEAVTTL
ncbi:MAG: hypothetical protein WCR67_02610 [Bacilli bacterium]